MSLPRNDIKSESIRCLSTWDATAFILCWRVVVEIKGGRKLGVLTGRLQVNIYHPVESIFL